MASESTPMKKPDDEGGEKDDLFAEELDDIDLDALLEDDEEVDLLKDEPLALEEKAAPAPAQAVKTDDVVSDNPELIDDGEIDLLADDDEGAMSGGPSRAGGSPDEEMGLGDEDSAPLRVDGSTNGRPPGSESDDLLGVEEAPMFDLLAEDDDLVKDAPAPVEADPAPEVDLDLLAEEPAEAPALLPAESEEEEKEKTSPVAEKQSRAAQETVALTPGKKPGRFAGKGVKFGGKGKAAQKAAAKAAPAEEPEEAEPEAEAKPGKRKPSAVKVKREKVVAVAAVAAPAVRTARSTVPFVCSECYEEFLIPATYSQEMMSCPECLHVGKRPDADFLRTINVHKSGERKSFALAVGVGAMLAVLLLALMWLLSPYGAGTGGAGTMPMILLGASALLAVVFIWLIVRFEGNRWEVYF